MRFRIKYFLVLATGFVLFLSACNKGMVSDTAPDPPHPPTPDTIETVPADGIMETVTWNIEWYGSDNRSPDNDDLQTYNVITVLDSLKADLYALQEISGQGELDKLTVKMMGYKGFVADHITYNQRTAFVYNTQTIDSVSSGPISEFQKVDDWAGRLPLYFKFKYKRQKNDPSPLDVYAVVIHAKASDNQESYGKRKRAAKSLHNYLSRMKPDAHIIFLGDYNDDVDASIYQESETPYQSFIDDTDEFSVLTKSLSEKGQSSTVFYEDMVDHITVSNELESFYESGSVRAFEPTSFIENYGVTTSDHYPIVAKFNVAQ